MPGDARYDAGFDFGIVHHTTKTGTRTHRMRRYDVSEGRIELQPIGLVESVLADPQLAPKQADEGRLRPGWSSTHAYGTACSTCRSTAT